MPKPADQQQEPIDALLLEGFKGIGPVNEQDAKLDKDWKRQLSYGKNDEKVLLNGFKDTIKVFNDEWSQAMSALERYREKYNVVLGASTPMQGIVEAWKTEKEGYEKADLAIAIVTAIPGAVKLVLKGPKVIGIVWQQGGKLIQWMAGAKNAEKFGSVAAQLLARQKEIGLALAKEAGKNLDDVVAGHKGNLGKAIDELFQAVMQKRGWHYLSPLGPQKAIEMGIAIPEVMKNGVDVSSLVTRIVRDTHIALGAAAKGQKPMINAAKLAEDLEILRAIVKNEPNFIQSLKTAVVDVSMGMKAEGQEGSTHLMKWLESLEKAPSVLEYKQIQQDLANAMQALKQAEAANDVAGMTRAIKAAQVFGQQLTDAQKTKVVQRYLKAAGDLQKAQEAAESMGQATVKLLSDADHALLTKLLDAGGDLGKLQETLSPEELAKLLAPPAQGGFPFGSMMGAGQLAGGDSEAAGAGAGDPLDLLAMSDVFGMTNQGSASDAMLHGLWGGITSPVQTYAEIIHSLEMQKLYDELIKEHGKDMQEMARLLQEAVTHLQLAAQAIEDGRIPGNVHGKGESIRENLAKLLEMVHHPDGASPDWAEAHRAELDKLISESKATLEMIGNAGDKLGAIETIIREIAHQLEEAKKADKLYVLNPQILKKVETAHGALIFLMGDLQTALLLPQDFGLAPSLQLTPQQEAGLKAAGGGDTWFAGPWGRHLLTGGLAVTLGLGLGTAFGEGQGTSTYPTAPVPVVQPADGSGASDQTGQAPLLGFPNGGSLAMIDIAGPNSLTRLAELTLRGSSLTFDVEGLVFNGTLDQSNGSFRVDNAQGWFEGVIEGDRLSGDHEYQGQAYTFTGELTEPLVELGGGEQPAPEPQPLAGAIGDDVAFQPQQTGSGIDWTWFLLGVGVVAAGTALASRGSSAGAGSKELDEVRDAFRKYDVIIKEAAKPAPYGRQKSIDMGAIVQGQGNFEVAVGNWAKAVGLPWPNSFPEAKELILQHHPEILQPPVTYGSSLEIM